MKSNRFIKQGIDSGELRIKPTFTMKNNSYFGQNIPQKSFKGSSTVLIILIIVLLVTLAVLSVGITNSGYKLSKRMGEKYQQFYELESEADRCYVEVQKEYFSGKDDSENSNVESSQESGENGGDEGDSSANGENSLNDKENSCGLTAEKLLEIGCENPVIEDGRIAFDVTENERTMHIELEPQSDCLEIVEWREVPAEFEIVNFD